MSLFNNLMSYINSMCLPDYIITGGFIIVAVAVAIIVGKTAFKIFNILLGLLLIGITLFYISEVFL